MNRNLQPPTPKRNRIWLLALLGASLLGTGGGVGYWLGISKTAAPLSSPSAQPVPADDIHPHESKLKNPDGSWRYTNRLAGETSPYLLLHAHNPVDWYPWGPEALERAKQEGKPIFLSVGYSTCYWCHVMERLVFSDPEIAKQMNQWFVNIKVDREERPDLDQIYMTATRLINGSGGWPNSVFLTPGLNPFFAGTYFPPEDKFGRPGFPRVLQALHTAWQDERDTVEKQAEQVAEGIRRVQEGRRTSTDSTALDRTLIDGAVQTLKDRYDATHGGFSRAPKFPPDHALALLMANHEHSGVPELLEMVTHTLEMMGRGGMYDHLGGGFHRYATDERWWVPHFEKMLYNQAQLAKVYLLAYRTTHQDRFRRTAEEIFRYVKRTMTSPEGGFYSALDSETHGKEGDYYLWTEEEIRETLGGDADLFLDAYGLASMPEGEGKVLYLSRPLQTVAADLGIAPEDLQSRLVPLKGALLRVRKQRERPLLDTKIVTSWNGLMIDAYALGYEVLREDAYLEEARRAAEFILNRMRDPQGNLFRTYREGQRKYQGYQEDYAFLIRGLLGLYRATGEDGYLRQAESLADHMVHLFQDVKTGGFYFTSGSEDLIARTKNPHDSAIPSGNAVAAHVLLTLHEITGRQDYLQLARQTLRAFAQPAKENPGAYYHLLQAVHRYLDTHPEDRSSASPAPEAPPSSPLPDGADLVQAEASLSPDPPIPGEPFQVSVTLHVTDGWHINAHPASLKILIPTTLTVTSDLPVEVLSVDYPPARKLDLGFAEQPLAVYEGDVTIRATLKLAPEGYPETGGQLRFRLDYQACDDSRCLAPASLILPVEIGPIQQSVDSEG